MNTIQKLLGTVGIAAALVIATPAPVQAQTYYGGIISTGLVTVAFATTNNVIDTAKPPNLFTGNNPRDNSWFEVPKDRGISIQLETGGTATNNKAIFEASVYPTSRTNWTNTRYIVVNVPTTVGVIMTNLTAAQLGNVRGIRLLSYENVNAAGTFYVTNALIGTWR